MQRHTITLEKMMKIEVNATQEMLDALLIDELSTHLAMCKDNDPWCEEDAHYNKKLEKALKRVLRYYTTDSEYKRIIKKIKKGKI